MNVNELKIFIEAIANRDQTGNSMTPDEYNSYLARANEDKFRIETGIREIQTPIFFQSNQTSTDAMRPFIEVTSLPVVAGLATIPTDYRHALVLSHITNGRVRKITALNIDEFEDILDSATKKPSIRYPYCTQRGDKIEIAPSTITTIKFQYFKMPPIPVWGYTIVNDEEVYDSATSVQLGWADIYHIDIARLILGYIGINFRDADLSNYAEMIKQKGS